MARSDMLSQPDRGLGKSTVERRVKPINATGSPRAADNRTPE